MVEKTIYARILGTNYCGAMKGTSFKRHELFQDVLCRRDYTDMEVAIFSHQIQSEYYGGNRSVSIEGISLENFISFTKGRYQLNLQTRQSHALFHSYLSDDRKQDSAITTAHSKLLI